MDQIDDKDGTATAMQKFGSNLARSIGGGARAGFMGGRALIAKSRADREKKKLQRHDDLQNRRRESEIERICMVRREMQKYLVKMQKDLLMLMQRRGLDKPALPAGKKRLALPPSTPGGSFDSTY